MSAFHPLPQAEEDDLHAKRLLNIEEKPFKRIQKRLLAPSNPIQEYLRRKPIDAPTANENGTGEVVSDEEQSNGFTSKSQEQSDTYLQNLQQFHHATLHDFSALTTSLARLQFLISANEKERARYARQATTITEQHASIREDTARSRVRLDEARQQLQVRKGYDLLAERVLYVPAEDGKERVKAKTREELGRESEKLRNEIEELEREGIELGHQWADRREALANVIAEAARLRRIVRGEPEHVEEERRDEDGESEVDGEEGEGAQKRREDEDEGLLGPGDRDADRDGGSNVGTPRPLDEGSAPPLPEHGGGMTPLPNMREGESGGMTPRSMVDDVEHENGNEAGGLTPRPTVTDGGSALKYQIPADDDDIDMADQQPPQGTDVPEVKVDEAEKAEFNDMDTTQEAEE